MDKIYTSIKDDLKTDLEKNHQELYNSFFPNIEDKSSHKNSDKDLLHFIYSKEIDCPFVTNDKSIIELGKKYNFTKIYHNSKNEGYNKSEHIDNYLNKSN